MQSGFTPILIPLFLLLLSISNQHAIGEEFSCYQELLSTYVCDGKVDYAGLKSSQSLGKCESEFKLDGITLSKEEKPNQLAFWINSYNYYTLRLMTENFPIKSIQKLPKAWDTPLIPFGKAMLTLNQVEHEKIRKVFNEPRIHFAVNCAAIGCPELSSHAYSGKIMDSQLDHSAKRFLTDKSKNRIEDKTLYLSHIFEWYGSDFKNKGGYTDYVKQVLGLKGEYKVKFLEYDWSINAGPACGAKKSSAKP